MYIDIDTIIMIGLAVMGFIALIQLVCIKIELRRITKGNKKV